MVLHNAILTQSVAGRRSRKGHAQKEQANQMGGGMWLVLESLHVTLQMPAYRSDSCLWEKRVIANSELYLGTVYPNHRQPAYATPSNRANCRFKVFRLDFFFFLTCRGIEPRTLHMLGKLSLTEQPSRDLKLLYLWFLLFSIQVQHKVISTTITTTLC